MKLAVFLPNWIGDAVMATPALRAIREWYADDEIVGVLRPYVAEVLDGLDLVDRVLWCDPRGSDMDHRGRRLVRMLRGERFDVAVLFPNSLRTAWWAWRSGATRRVGYNRDARGWLLTDSLPAGDRRRPTPALDNYLAIAKYLGCEVTSRRLELATSDEDEQRLARFWAGAGSAASGRPVICLNPGGAFGAAKHWPPESFGRLARHVADELGRSVLVLCGPAEREAARRIVAIADHPRVVSLADDVPTIGLTKAAIRNAEVLITTDSGPRHFAAAFDVPVLTLFGPTHIAWSETDFHRAVNVQLDVDCGPCQQRTCPLGHHRCMRELDPEMIQASLWQLMTLCGLPAEAA